MSVDAGKAKLIKGLKDLRARWELTRASWNDAVSLEFERTYLEPLEQEIRQALAAMDHLGEVLVRVRQDCG